MPILYILLVVLLAFGTSKLFADKLQRVGSLLSQTAIANQDQLTSIFQGAPTTPPTQTEPDPAEPTTPELENVVYNRDVQVPYYNTEYAHLECERLGIDCPLYFGDSDLALANGAGQYHGSWMPGYGGTILVAGHNYSVFYPLDYVEVGDVFTLTTNYGVFQYQVDRTDILSHRDKSAFDLSQRDEELLVLYTCWPISYVSPSKDKRLFVYCEKIAGPTVIEEVAK